MDKIIDALKVTHAKKAAVIGGGFIGIETAENLKEMGLEVTLVEMQNQVFPPIDFDMAQIVHKHLADNGMGLILGDGVKSFADNGSSVTVETQQGKKLDVDVVILAIGVRPNSELAVDAGLEVNGRKGIVVDESLRTADSDIYAVGDAIEVVDYITKEKAMIPLAGPANKMGRMAADNICGRNRKYKGTQGSSVAKVFELTVANTGVTEKTLNSLGKKINEDYKVTVIHPKSHAGYYPGGMPMTLKTIFDLEGTVLGAQCVGYDGVEKRIDVIAAAIRFGATVYDLEETELCYAPPFSSAKDPVNMSGFYGENILSGTVNNVTFQELADMKDVVYLDVRTVPEVSAGCAEGCVHIPVDELRGRLDELDKSKTYVVYCAVGIRAYIACRILMQNGFDNILDLAGGYTTYKVMVEDFSDISPKHSGGPDDSVAPAPPEKSEKTEIHVEVTKKVDARGLQCPGPIMQLYQAMEEVENGDTINVLATDPGFFSDCAAWCARTKNTYIKGEKIDKHYAVWVQKGCEGEECAIPTVKPHDDKAMVVFSGEFDKVMAAFIIANGAAAMGRKVTLFFTFWGLNALRKEEKVPVKKGFMEKMFGIMMPRGSKKLKISKMNMMGMGTAMMKKIMKDKNVTSLEDLIQSAMDSGVRIVACTMSMDVMGITEEELIDGIEYAGVASFLGASESSDTNLFI
jgi:peroxiredoxin family protein/rhodanese-related sulfurtransferase/TusA-related sulfurtransferase